MNSVKSETADNVKPVSHLEDVGETYVEHFGHAMSFSLRMIGAGFCCMVHAFFPEAFKKTGSSCINVLYDEMVVNRKNLSKIKHSR